jgi:hypothetical protein
MGGDDQGTQDDHGAQEIDTARGLARYVMATSMGYDLDRLPSEVQGLLIQAAHLLLKWSNERHEIDVTDEITHR